MRELSRANQPLRGAELARRGIIGLFIVAGTQAKALDFDFSGTFEKDNDIAQFEFTVENAGAFKVFSSSWFSGGFDPILALWDSTGTRIAQQDDGLVVGTTFSNGTGYTHGCWDSCYTIDLSPGSYIVTIAQFGNFAAGNNLSDGFIYDEDPDFTCGVYGDRPFFNGAWHTGARTGDFVFHVVNLRQGGNGSCVPDGSSTLILLGSGMALVEAVRRRFNS